MPIVKSILVKMSRNRAKRGTLASDENVDFSSRIDNLEELFSKQLSEFKNEIVNMKQGNITEKPPQVLDDLENKLKTLEESIKKNIDALKKQVSEIGNELDGFNQQVDHIAQNSFKNNLLIYGINETQKEDLTEVVISIINKQLNINLQKNDISDCYRYGGKNGERTRPVAIEFVHAWKRIEIFYKKSSFKGTNYVFSEQLTTPRYQVYREVREKLKNDCWTKNGKITFLWKNKKYSVTTSDQFYSIIGKK